MERKLKQKEKLLADSLAVTYVAYPVNGDTKGPN